MKTTDTYSQVIQKTTGNCCAPAQPEATPPGQAVLPCGVHG